jgi:hypothetical protein
LTITKGESSKRPSFGAASAFMDSYDIFTI